MPPSINISLFPSGGGEGGAWIHIHTKEGNLAQQVPRTQFFSLEKNNNIIWLIWSSRGILKNF